jgi:hypothetical protein
VGGESGSTGAVRPVSPGRGRGGGGIAALGPGGGGGANAGAANSVVGASRNVGCCSMVGSSAPLGAPAEEPGAAHPGGDRRGAGAGCCSTAFPSHDEDIPGRDVEQHGSDGFTYGDQRAVASDGD